MLASEEVLGGSKGVCTRGCQRIRCAWAGMQGRSKGGLQAQARPLSALHHGNGQESVFPSARLRRTVRVLESVARDH